MGRWLRILPALVLGAAMMLGASMGTMAAPPEPRALPALGLAPDIPVRSIMLRRAFPDHPVPPPAEERFPVREDLPDGSFGEQRRLPAVPTTDCDKDIDLSGSLDGVVAITAQDNGTCTNADIDTYLAGTFTYVVQAGGQEIAWTHTDVTDPANPVIVGQFYWSGAAGANTYTPDAKAFHQGVDDYVALSLERMSFNAFCGVVIVKITDPATPVIESQAIGADWCDVHNTYVETDANGDGEYIYLTADGPNDMRVLDIAHGGSVANPVEIGRYIAPGANNDNYVHDITVLDHGGTVGRRVYLSYWDSGLVILDADDVTPGTSPTPIVGPNVIDPAGFLTHHAWASQDGSLAFIQDEFLGGPDEPQVGEPVQMWNVSDPANPTYVDGLALGIDVPVNPAHNFEIRYDIDPNRLYVAWYRLGLQAWDFDTNGFLRPFPVPHTAELYHQVQTEADDQLYSGAWGVRMEEFGTDGLYIFQSDRNYGLIVSCLGGTCPQPATGTIDGIVTDSATSLPIVGASVSADTDQSDTTDAAGDYALTSVPTGGRTVTATASGYIGQQTLATVTDGGTSIVDFSLTPANQKPVASFTYECIDLICTFTDASYDPDGTIAEWVWIFGDGAGSGLQNPEPHTYGSAGTYNVTLRVTDDGGLLSDLFEVPVTVTSSGEDNPPSVTITEPTGGTVSGKRVKLRADASDDYGVTQVEFRLDGVLIGTDNDGSNGWLFRWDSRTMANGSYSLTAQATDTKPQTGPMSDPVNIIVDNGGNGGGTNCPPNSNKPACR